MGKLSSKISSWISFSKSVAKEIPHLKLPSRAETMSYLIIVLIMALITSLMFFAIDQLSYKFISKILMFFH